MSKVFVGYTNNNKLFAFKNSYWLYLEYQDAKNLSNILENSVASLWDITNNIYITSH